MSLSPRLIAMQGLGGGALLTALHGLVAFDDNPPPPDLFGSVGGAVGGATMSMGEWLARGSTALDEPELQQQPATRRTKRRRRNAALLLLFNRKG